MTIEVAENRYKTAQEARRGITHDYHPFSLDTGERQTPETLRQSLRNPMQRLKL